MITTQISILKYRIHSHHRVRHLLGDVLGVPRIIPFMSSVRLRYGLIKKIKIREELQGIKTIWLREAGEQQVTTGPTRFPEHPKLFTRETRIQPLRCTVIPGFIETIGWIRHLLVCLGLINDNNKYGGVYFFVRKGMLRWSHYKRRHVIGYILTVSVVTV